MVNVRNEIIPVLPISKVFKQEEIVDEDNNLMVIIELEQKEMMMPVRRIVDRREIVVKSLGSEFGDLTFLSGATVLGDGSVSLILDIEGLFAMGSRYNEADLKM